MFSFSAVIILTADYNRDSVKQAYIDMMYENRTEDIVKSCNNLFTGMNLKRTADSARVKEEEFLKSIIEQIYSENNEINIFISKTIADEDKLSFQCVYSSPDNENEGVYYSYDDKNENFIRFQKSDMDILLKDKPLYLKDEIYSKDKSRFETRISYSRYYSDLNWIITCYFNSGDIEAAADTYAEELTVKNNNTISIVFKIILAAIIFLFFFLCHIEFQYYNKLEEFFMDEKLKTDEKYNKLKLLSQTDSLTKCYNRKYINEAMHKAFVSFREGQLSSSVILFDIDNFKKVNDTYGHAAGDDILVNISSAVRNCVRRDDVVARWGGEEFVVFLKYTHVDSALTVAEKIRKTVEGLEVKNNDTTIRVTVSIGVSGFKNHDSSFNESVERADISMYTSKKSGKNRITLYTEKN